MIDLNKMIKAEIAKGYDDANAQAKVCQDIVLKAIASSPLSHNITIKGGVVMRSKTRSVRRATQDLDLYVYRDSKMREKEKEDVVRRVESVFQNKAYFNRLNNSDKKWLDEDLNVILGELIIFLKTM